MLLTAADLLMVSALGTTAVAAVSIFSQPRMVILCVTRSFSVALSAYVARMRGEKPDTPLTACTRQSLLLGTVAAALLLAATWIGAGPILRLAGAQTSYLALALEYAYPALLSLFLSGPSIVLHGILAGLGDTRHVLRANVLGNLINVCCNAILIYGAGPVPALGVRGAGVSTAIGTAVTLLYTLRLFAQPSHAATLRGEGRWLPQQSYIHMLRPLTAGVFTEQAVERFGMFAFARLVAGLGPDMLSVHHICSALCDVYYCFSQGLGKASLVLAGNDLGRSRGSNLHHIVKISRNAATGTSVIAAGLYAVLRFPLLHLYHLQGSEQRIGGQMMLFVALVSIPEALAMVHAGVLRGAGHTGFVALYSLISIAVIRPILTWMLVYPLGLGLYGAWMALLFDQLTRALCSMAGAYHAAKKRDTYSERREKNTEGNRYSIRMPSNE